MKEKTASREENALLSVAMRLQQLVKAQILAEVSFIPEDNRVALPSDVTSVFVRVRNRERGLHPLNIVNE
jgi:hypothetical protein